MVIHRRPHRLMGGRSVPTVVNTGGDVVDTMSCHYEAIDRSISIAIDRLELRRGDPTTRSP
jgi:hypothetical protein